MPGSVTAQSLNQELYYYINSTRKIQIVCLVNNNILLKEKVVYPQQKVLFASIPKGRLEIYAGTNGKKILQDILHF